MYVCLELNYDFGLLIINVVNCGIFGFGRVMPRSGINNHELMFN